jgi:hypothetical protein
MTMPKTDCITICLILGAHSTYAVSEARQSPSPSYLESFVEAPTHSFVIATPDGEENMSANAERIQYNPTFSPNFGVRAKFNKFVISHSQKSPSSADPKIYGKSSYQDWQVDVQPLRWLNLSSFYQNYQGFYADLNGKEGLQSSFSTNEEPEASSTARSTTFEDPIKSRPDIQVKWLGAHITGALPLVPLINAATPNPQQKLPEAMIFDLLLDGSYSVLDLGGAASLIPQELQTSLAAAAPIKSFEATTLTGSLGLEAGFQMPSGTRFSFGASGGLGSQAQSRRATDGSISAVQSSSVQTMRAWLSYDFAGERHGWGIAGRTDTLSSEVGNLRLTSNRLAALASYRLIFR